jgi:EmrB/QacA subfamily drug resistance transporter
VRVAVQYGLLAGPLLSMVDSSIVNVAVAPIARGLHTSIGTAQWAVSGYLLALGTGLAGTAWLARRFGTVGVYRASLIAFTVASAACAFAPPAAPAPYAADVLVAARIVQGLVAAPLVPLAMSMLLGRGGKADTVPRITGILLFAGPAFGPALGGALIGAAGWRTIFAVNLPLGALAVVAARRLPGDGDRRYGEKFDVTGLVVLAGGLGTLLYGATNQDWRFAAAGAALLAGYGWHATRTDSPALDLSLARRPAAALSMGLCAMASVVTWAAVFLLPVFAQEVQGHSALAAGIAMAPQGIVTGLSTVFGRSARLPVRVTVVAGFAVLAALYTDLARSSGPVTALHVTGLMLAGIAASGAMLAVVLPGVATRPPPDVPSPEVSADDAAPRRPATPQ